MKCNGLTIKVSIINVSYLMEGQSTLPQVDEHQCCMSQRLPQCLHHHVSIESKEYNIRRPNVLVVVSGEVWGHHNKIPWLSSMLHVYMLCWVWCLCWDIYGSELLCTIGSHNGCQSIDLSVAMFLVHGSSCSIQIDNQIDLNAQFCFMAHQCSIQLCFHGSSMFSQISMLQWLPSFVSWLINVQFRFILMAHQWSVNINEQLFMPPLSLQHPLACSQQLSCPQNHMLLSHITCMRLTLPPRSIDFNHISQVWAFSLMISTQK